MPGAMPTCPLQRCTEMLKSLMNEYLERLRNVEHADFNPLVFTTAGGMAPQTQIVIKRIAAALSETKGLPKSVVIGWLRCKLSFALLRTTLLCIHGTRARRSADPEVNRAEYGCWTNCLLNAARFIYACTFTCI